MRTITMVTIAIMITCVAGCTDAAKAEYERCLELEKQGDIKGAGTYCSSAAGRDPTSTSGKKAREKVIELAPVIEKMNAEQKEREARDYEARAAQQAQAVKALRAKIHRSQAGGDYENDKCAGQGKPGTSYRYGGGTYAENETVAYGDGCKAFDDQAVAQLGHAQNHFCCP